MTGSRATLDALILAAGASTRLGRPKQLVRLDGRTLLERAVALAARCVDGAVHVVVGEDAATDRAALSATSASVHEFTGWEQGQGASLAFGLGHASAGDGVLVMLTDQYRLTAGDLDALVERWRRQPQRPAAARYAGTVGAPVVWPRADVGALIRDRRPGRERLDPANCSVVDLPRAAFDLDTPADLARLRAFERALRG